MIPLLPYLVYELNINMFLICTLFFCKAVKQYLNALYKKHLTYTMRVRDIFIHN